MSSATQEIITALMAGGMDAAVAAALVAQSAVEMTVKMSAKSIGAVRQQRYRERNESVTKRNESVTERNAHEASRSVTKRNESVTTLRPADSPISYLLTSSSSKLEEKKESKKEHAPRKRNAPLRDDWVPSLPAYQIAEQHGVDLKLVEQIFRNYLKSSGKLYANYDAAFHNFLINQRKFNGNSHAKPKSAIIQAADDLCRTIASFDGPPRRAVEICSDEGETPPRLLSHR